MNDETYFIGIDLGTQSSFWVIQNTEGKAMKRLKAINDEHAIEAILKPYQRYHLKVVMEATTIYYWMYHVLKKLNCHVVLAHPLKTRAIAAAKVKNDRLDATILCNLLRADLIPQSYIPTDEIRALREMTRQHIRLTQIRTRIKNQCHALLVKLNLKPTERFSDIFGRKGRQWLSELPLPDVFAFQKTQLLDQIEYYNRLIGQVDRKIEKMLRVFPTGKRLMQEPGIGTLSAAMLIAEIGEIKRFPTPKQLVGYAGIAPGLYESGKTSHARPITHEGNKFLRWILCEIVQHHVRKPGPLRTFYLRLKEKKGHGKALVATARKLLIQVYYILKEKARTPQPAFVG
jgi:transposase